MKSVDVKFLVGDEAYHKESALDGKLVSGRVVSFECLENRRMYVVKYPPNTLEDDPTYYNENDLLTEEEAVDQAIEATKIRLVELEGRKRLLSE